MAKVEIFTPLGWVKMEELKTNDFVYSKDKTNNLIPAKVKSNKIHRADMIETDDGKTLPIFYTLPTKTRKEHPTIIKNWGVLTTGGKRVYLDMFLNWTGKDFVFTLPPTSYEMPHGGVKILNNGVNIEGINFARFLGWYISEGCFDGKYFCITQSAKSIYNHEIREVLKSCGLNFTEKISKASEITYSVGNKNLKEWLLKECYVGGHTAHFKKVPDVIKNATPKIISAFLEAYNHGDGHIHKGERIYSTSSKLLADDIFTLILKTGTIPSLRLKDKKGSHGYIHGRKITRTVDSYIISELKVKFTLLDSTSTKRYSADVHNLEIEGETKLYMIRFPNARPFFVRGGTFPLKI